MRKITLPVLWQLRAGDVEKRSVSFTCGDRFEDAGKPVVDLAEVLPRSKSEECGRNQRLWDSAFEVIQQDRSGCQQRGVVLVIVVPEDLPGHPLVRVLEIGRASGRERVCQYG